MHDLSMPRRVSIESFILNSGRFESACSFDREVGDFAARDTRKLSEYCSFVFFSERMSLV